MDWRREFKPELIEPEDVGVEAETGKMLGPSFTSFSLGSELTGRVVF
jgi:hypothetical protein